MGLSQRLGGGLLLGVSRDPILGTLLKGIMNISPDFQQEDLDELEYRLGDSRAGEASAIIGEFAPLIATGAGGFIAGRLAVKGVATAAAKKAATTTVRGRSVAGLAERGVETLGGSAGVGAVEGLGAALEGEPIPEVLKEFGIATALTAAFDIGIVGASLAGSAKARVGLGLVNQKEALRQGQRAALPIISRNIQEDKVAVAKELKKLGDKLGAQQTLDSLNVHLDRVLPADRSKLQKLLKAEQKILKKGTSIEDLQSSILARNNRINKLKTDRQTVKDLDFSILTNNTPYNPASSQMRMIHRVIAQGLKTPEAALKQQGIGGVMLFLKAEKAELATRRRHLTTDFEMQKIIRGLGVALDEKIPRSGLSSITAGRLKKIEEVGDVFEAHGVAGVRAQFGDDVAEIMSTVERLQNEAYAPLEQFIGKRLTTEELRGGAYVSHMKGSNVNQEEYEKAIERVATDFFGGSKLSAQKAVAASRRAGTRRHASVDFERQLPLTLKQLRDKGVPVGNWLENVERHLKGAARRHEYAKQFGFKDELKTALVDIAKAEGADSDLVNSMGDMLLGRKFKDSAGLRLARMLTSVQATLKLPFAVFFNATQQTNNMVAFNFKNSFRRTYKGLKTDEVQKALDHVAGVTADVEFEALRRVQSDTLAADTTIWDRMARWVLNGTGFSAVEKANRRSAGNAAMFSILDTVLHGVDGAYKGSALNIARRRMRSLGLNLDEVVEAARGTIAEGGNVAEAVSHAVNLAARGGNSTFDDALFKGMQLTQFAPTLSRIPIYAQYPAGRVAYQFKNFALNQGIFFRDGIIAEAALGNFAPLAVAMSIYPVAGEIAMNTVHMLKGRDFESVFSARSKEDAILQYLDDFTQLGALGIAQSAFLSAKYGSAGAVELLLGPTVSDLNELATSLLQTDAKSAVRVATTQPVSQAFGAIARGAGGGLDLVSQYVQGEPEAANSATLSELIQRSRR
tara:strand:+ start:3634 stop:6540 length:2907 start_codon:yes stop_codon:yes gene_type:complete